MNRTVIPGPDVYDKPSTFKNLTQEPLRPPLCSKGLSARIFITLRVIFNNSFLLGKCLVNLGVVGIYEQEFR